MKKNILYRIGALLLLSGMSSCDAFLTVDPTDFVRPSTIKTAKDLDNLRIGCYDALGARGVYGRAVSEFFDMSNDLVMTNNSSAKGLMYYDHNQSDAELNASWRAFYDGIARCNTFLETAPCIEMDAKQRDVWVAEIRVMRALLYFDLVQVWGDVPMRIMTVESPLDLMCPPKDKMEIIKFVLSEIESVEKVLPEMTSVPINMRSSVISKSFAQGLLARIYLRIVGEPFNVADAAEQALKWAEQVVLDNKHSLNPSYTEVFLNLSLDKYDRTYNEIMFEIEFTTTGKGDTKGEGGYIGAVFSTMIDKDRNFITYGNYNATRKYYEMFKVVKGPGAPNDTPSHDIEFWPSPDVRRDWNICPYYYKGGVFSPDAPKKRPNGNSAINPYYAENYNKSPGKFYRDKETNVSNQSSISPINYPVMRYAEILLIIAEVEALVNNSITNRSLWALNEVWHRAAPTETPKTAADFPGGVAEYLDYLLDERARELFMEGHRRQDLIRRGVFVQTMKNVDVVPNDPTVTRRIVDVVEQKHTLFPYPEREMNLNPGMAGKQNKGW